jgi:hypothetical protein
VSKIYYISNKPTVAIKLPMIFLGISSRSFKKIAAAIKIITTLKVVTAETTLRFPTTNRSATHDTCCKNLKKPVLSVSVSE